MSAGCLSGHWGAGHAAGVAHRQRGAVAVVERDARAARRSRRGGACQARRRCGGQARGRTGKRDAPPAQRGRGKRGAAATVSAADNPAIDGNRIGAAVAGPDACRHPSSASASAATDRAARAKTSAECALTPPDSRLRLPASESNRSAIKVDLNSDKRAEGGAYGRQHATPGRDRGGSYGGVPQRDETETRPVSAAPSLADPAPFGVGVVRDDDVHFEHDQRRIWSVVVLRRRRGSWPGWRLRVWRYRAVLQRVCGSFVTEHVRRDGVLFVRDVLAVVLPAVARGLRRRCRRLRCSRRSACICGRGGFSPRTCSSRRGHDRSGSRWC